LNLEHRLNLGHQLSLELRLNLGHQLTLEHQPDPVGLLVPYYLGHLYYQEVLLFL
jgi:hypothetical protein